MAVKLFIVCPFSHLELFLKNIFGHESYYISAPGSISSFHDSSFSDSIKWMVLNNNVTEIFFAVDTHCRFINNVLSKQKGYDTEWEFKLQTIFETNLTEIKGVSDMKQKKNLFAEKIILKQASEMLSIKDFKTIIIDQNIKLMGLVTARTNSSYREFNIPTPNNNNELSVYTNRSN